MRISELSVRRPVFATVISMMLVIFGLVSLQRLSVREYPDIDRPTVSITTAYRGASAAIIETKITQIVELTTASIGPHILPQATPELLAAVDWLAPFVDAQHRIVLSIHALVLETKDRCLVVDTCIGNDKERTYPRWNRMQGRFLEDFTAAGFALDRVDTVLCTHMHVDHVGWNTRLVGGRWEPTFANARYLFAEREYANWTEQHSKAPVACIADSGRKEIVHVAGLSQARSGSSASSMMSPPTKSDTRGMSRWRQNALSPSTIAVIAVK